jgi:hypothetical protein
LKKNVSNNYKKGKEIEKWIGNTVKRIVDLIKERFYIY